MWPTFNVIAFILNRYIDSYSKWIRQKCYQFFIKEKLKKTFYFLTCILPNYVPHEIRKEFWKNIQFENMMSNQPIHLGYFEKRLLSRVRSLNWMLRSINYVLTLTATGAAPMGWSLINKCLALRLPIIAKIAGCHNCRG